MSDFTHKIAYGEELAAFFSVAPRPSRPEESSVRSRVYEVSQENGLRLWFRYAETDDGDQAEVILSLGETRIFSCDFDSLKMLWDQYPSTAEPHLILLEGSTSVRICKNPWSVSVSNSTFYENNEDPDPYAYFNDNSPI